MRISCSIAIGVNTNQLTIFNFNAKHFNYAKLPTIVLNFNAKHFNYAKQPTIVHQDQRNEESFVNNF
jgi:hypothetical protein